MCVCRARPHLDQIGHNVLTQDGQDRTAVFEANRDLARVSPPTRPPRHAMPGELKGPPFRLPALPACLTDLVNKVCPSKAGSELLCQLLELNKVGCICAMPSPVSHQRIGGSACIGRRQMRRRTRWHGHLPKRPSGIRLAELDSRVPLEDVHFLKGVRGVTDNRSAGHVSAALAGPGSQQTRGPR